MTEIPLPNPQIPDIFSYGFDKNLNRERESMETPAVYDANDPSPLSAGGVMSGQTYQSPNFKAATTGWQIKANGDAEFNAGTFRGALVANSIDIPDKTSANSFHTDNQGNSWWGAATYAAAPIKISNAGVLTATNVVITGDGFNFQTWFGDGSDGNATILDPTYTLTSDKFFDTLTVGDATHSVSLQTGNYRIFCKTKLNIVNGTISNSGGNGGAGGNGGSPNKYSPGAAGAAGANAAASAGTLPLAAAGKAGGAGGTGGAPGGTGMTTGGNGTAGENATTSIGVFANGTYAGGPGGNGGRAEVGQNGAAGGTGGAKGTLTASKLSPHCAVVATYLHDIAGVQMNGSAGNGSGAGGGGGKAAANPGDEGGGGGGGGGSGASGGIIAIYAKEIVIGVSGNIRAEGGTGGGGGNGSIGTIDGGGGGGGGGGMGGNGGVIILCYSILTNSGSISVSAGTGGSYGTPGPGVGIGDAGTVGSPGDNGFPGKIIYIHQ